MEYIHEIVFILAFFVVLLFSYLSGIAEKNNDGILKNISDTSINIGVIIMIVSWSVKWGMKLPGDFERV